MGPNAKGDYKMLCASMDQSLDSAECVVCNSDGLAVCELASIYPIGRARIAMYVTHFDYFSTKTNKKQTKNSDDNQR